MSLAHKVIYLDDDAPWVVLIHGFGGSRHMWRRQEAQLQDSYNILIPELPGHGDALERTASAKELSLDDIADKLVALLDQLGIYRAHFVALSLGTLLMAAVVQRHRERVASTLLTGAIFGMPAPFRLVLHGGNMVKGILPFMWTIRVLCFVLLPGPSHRKARTFLLRECRKMGRDEFIFWYRLLVRELYCLHRSFFCFSGIPTLVVMGDRDHVFLSSAMAAMKEYSEIGQYEIIADSGHVCPLEKWKDFGIVTQHWLAKSQMSETGQRGKPVKVAL